MWKAKGVLKRNTVVWARWKTNLREEIRRWKTIFRLIRNPTERHCQARR